MNCLFRVDSSLQIGTGHVMRCLTLADELSRKGANVYFVCRAFSANLCELIESRGYWVHRLPLESQEDESVNVAGLKHAHWLGCKWQVDAEQTAAVIAALEKNIDWLIVDHYAIDYRWETYLNPYVGKILVIDDLADRRHHGDLLLDQNLFIDMSTRYTGLINAKCYPLLGPVYALLRPSFAQERKKKKNHDTGVRRILVFFGGIDLTNETAKAIEAICGINEKDIQVDVIVGKDNPYKEQIYKACNEHSQFIFHSQVENMAERMAKADLALGAGGTATWERCCVGLGTLVIAVADNQVEMAKCVHQTGAAIFIGRSEDISSDDILRAFDTIIQNPELLVEMRKKAMNVVDGKGVERVSNIMNHLC